MKAYVAFYKAFEASGSIMSDKAIALWTRGKYSHCELVVDGYMYSSSPRDGGVRRKVHAYNLNTWEYIEVDIDVKELYGFYGHTKDCKYDWLGILGFIFNNRDDPDKYFCSEWVATVLSFSKYRLSKIPSKLSPNGLFKELKGVIC